MTKWNATWVCRQSQQRSQKWTRCYCRRHHRPHDIKNSEEYTKLKKKKRNSLTIKCRMNCHFTEREKKKYIPIEPRMDLLRYSLCRNVPTECPKLCRTIRHTFFHVNRSYFDFFFLQNHIKFSMDVDIYVKWNDEVEEVPRTLPFELNETFWDFCIPSGACLEKLVTTWIGTLTNFDRFRSERPSIRISR